MNVIFISFNQTNMCPTTKFQALSKVSKTQQGLNLTLALFRSASASTHL